MNRRERDALLKFLEPLLRIRATDKDVTAETLILEHCARQPDALYLLVQRAMALEAALQAAQSRPAEGTAGPVDAQAAASGPDAPMTRAPEAAGDRSGAWGRGLLAQAGAIGAGVGLGVAAGIVAGDWLLDALDDDFTDGL